MSDSVCIFVVDDEALVLLTIEHALEDGGFAHKTVVSAEDALTLFENEGDTCRALITDVNLGGKLMLASTTSSTACWKAPSQRYCGLSLGRR